MPSSEFDRVDVRQDKLLTWPEKGSLWNLLIKRGELEFHLTREFPIGYIKGRSRDVRELNPFGCTVPRMIHDFIDNYLLPEITGQQGLP